MSDKMKDWQEDMQEVEAAGRAALEQIMDMGTADATERLADILAAAWRPQIAALAGRIIDDLADNQYSHVESANARLERLSKNVGRLLCCKLRAEGV